MSFVSDTSANWSSLQLLLQQALAMPVAERMQWLERAPEIPDLLREPLRRLLEVEAGADARGFLTLPPGSDAESLPATSVLIGDLIGPYRVLQEIGDGGMGSVWLAERADGSLKRKVALKLPRLTWAKDLARRMARERDILCSLEHPNIARLYDAGVDQHGRPFLALEYVEGQRLDSYCDERCLTIRQRLALFLQVLDAVQYAHVNLVLHRDLKPANILVNQRGEVRLLDFGIAKLLDESGDRSDEKVEQGARTLSRAMTPRYASPEQIQQERLTLASDIYSLGVVLFELLAGSSPVITANGSRAELELAVLASNLKSASGIRVDPEIARKRQTTPERLKRILRGELDAVLHRAMARNPSDRYVSAEAFRADIVRWLEGRPVIATPPSRLRALHKFVVRNSLGVGLGTAAVITILAVATVAVMQAREARQEWRRATATRDFLLGLFESANPELHGGREMTARELLLQAEKRLPDSLSTEPSVLIDLYSTLARAWASVGEYAKSYDTLKNRLTLVKSAASAESLNDALIDHAEAALRANDLAGFIASTLELEKLAAMEKLTMTQQSYASLYSGIRAYRRGDFGTAVSELERSQNIAGDLGDDDQRLRALLERLRAEVRRGELERAEGIFIEAVNEIKRSSLDDTEELRRTLEVLTVAFDEGCYSLGWPLITEALSESRNKKTIPNALRRAVYLHWLAWGLKVEKIDDGIELIAGLDNDQKSSNEMDLISSPAYNVIKAEYLIASNRLSEAEYLLGTLTEFEDSLPIARKRDLSLARIHLAFSKNRPEDAINELSKSIWSVEKGDSQNFYWEGIRSWYQGMAYLLAGRFQDARSSLEDAESQVRTQFGNRHPRRALISLNKFLLPTSVSGAMVSVNSKLLDDDVIESVGIVRFSFPESHTLSKRVSTFKSYRDLSERPNLNSISVGDRRALLLY